uniref:Thiamine pyrophosphokinase n=3 Tax=Aegilops tauschii subsp. strangulata TaxID=200361 RepID=A0A452YYI3_AEGTS
PAASADAYAVVVLNQRLPRFAPLLWDRAQVRVCADGGANRVFDGMPELLPGHARDDVRSRYKPDVIKGDMDSVRPEVKEYYSNLGTKIADQSHDQDTTDLHKCVAFITDNSPGSDKSNLCILVLGALGGRFDHEMGNINVLHLFPNIKIVLLSDDCLIFLLPRTHTHSIHIERSVEGPHCGLIPVGTPSTSTTTTGLRWNLGKCFTWSISCGVIQQQLMFQCIFSSDNTHMSFGGLISTSNIVDEDQVMVTSDSDLIWTISLRH